MLKRFAVVAVLALFVSSVAFGSDAKSADKDFKTTTKTALGVLKTSIKTAVGLFNEGVKANLATVKAGGAGLDALHTDLEGDIAAAVQDILDAVVIANESVDDDGGDDLDSADGTLANSLPTTQFNFMAGDGGTLDKFNASVQKEVAKAMSSIAKGAAKVVKAMAKNASHSLSARVNGLRTTPASTPNALAGDTGAGTMVPFQITHLVGINTNISAAGNCEVLAGGTSNAAVSFNFVRADLATTAGNGTAVTLTGDMFLVSSNATEDPQNFQVRVGEDDTGIGDGAEEDAIGAR